MLPQGTVVRTIFWVAALRLPIGMVVIVKSPVALRIVTVPVAATESSAVKRLPQLVLVVVIKVTPVSALLSQVSALAPPPLVVPQSVIVGVSAALETTSIASLLG